MFNPHFCLDKNRPSDGTAMDILYAAQAVQKITRDTGSKHGLTSHGPMNGRSVVSKSPSAHGAMPCLAVFQWAKLQCEAPVR